MKVNTDNLISITEANRNFSKIARMVEEKGAVVILKNNAPRYLVIEFGLAEQAQKAADEDVIQVSARLAAATAKRTKYLPGKGSGQTASYGAAGPACHRNRQRAGASRRGSA